MRTTLTDVGAAQTTQTDTALSLVATMFLPLTFLAGVFGMNFAYQSPTQNSPRPGIGIAMLNTHYGALKFWYLVGLFVICNLFFYDVNGWNEMFTVHAARAYQSKYWDEKEILNNYNENQLYVKRHQRKRKRNAIYLTLLILWCFTPYTFDYLSGKKTLF